MLSTPKQIGYTFNVFCSRRYLQVKLCKHRKVKLTKDTLLKRPRWEKSHRKRPGRPSGLRPADQLMRRVGEPSRDGHLLKASSAFCRAGETVFRICPQINNAEKREPFLQPKIELQDAMPHDTLNLFIYIILHLYSK